ncbi:MAG: hypothetical protein C9356_11825 [Oleiphilus sp.]|nr:MAG: hypothetical protein C9356_11825 [Oleiphilus sp.]
MNKRNTQLKHLLRNPKAMSDYQLHGRLPKATRPDSPLIRYLESLSVRERIALRNVRLSPKLGYQSNTGFVNAERMLRYLKPNEWMTTPWPAESVRIKAFVGPVTDALFESVQPTRGGTHD